MIVCLHAAVTAVVLPRIDPAPEEWCIGVVFAKLFIIFSHELLGLYYSEEPGYPSFWLLGAGVWAWSDAAAVAVLIDFAEARSVVMAVARILRRPCCRRCDLEAGG